MSGIAKKFVSEESGAITVDWVVLTAAILGVLFGALSTFHNGTVSHAELAGNTMSSLGIREY